MKANACVNNLLTFQRSYCFFIPDLDERNTRRRGVYENPSGIKLAAAAAAAHTSVYITLMFIYIYMCKGKDKVVRVL
jgi:hypothetical protein